MENKIRLTFASLRDKNMANRITQELSKRGIVCGFDTDFDSMNHLYVANEHDFEAAVDYFRVQIGIAKPIETPKEWQDIAEVSVGKGTYFILILCVLVYGLGYILKIPEVYSLLMFGPKKEGLTFLFIEDGQLWRLLTPAFLHFGIMHIVFNLMWWKDLGKIIEEDKGTLFLILFLVVTAVVSNVFQAVMSGANFGGLSGVVYALLGYLWIYKYINKDFKYGLPKRDVVMMIGWFFLCIFDVFSFSVANWAHGGGLLSGMIIGAILGYYDSRKIPVTA